jgi:hypothetical protein
MFHQETDHRAYMQNRWPAMERYRLRCAESGPDSPQKRATVTAIQSTMESLSGERQLYAQILEVLRRPNPVTGQPYTAA